MINAIELRIGNLVKDSISDLTYEVDLDFFHDLVSGGFDLELIDPIQLTEEWLKRFGFVRKEGRWTWIKIIYNEETTLPTTLQLWSGNDYVSVCRAGIGAMDCPCEHVHQLQNLYFALTGEELSLT